MDKYASFRELARNEKARHDYVIHFRRGHTGISIVAPHGGKIERGTMGLADAIAGTEHSYYCFEGKKTKNNRALHVTSNNFDEPIALSIVRNSRRVVTIHGAKGEEAAIYAGGRDQTLRLLMLGALSAQGFYAVDDPSPTRQGRGVNNICNRGLSGRGLQLEFTFAMRRALFAVGPGKIPHPTPLFYRCIDTIRAVLAHLGDEPSSSSPALCSGNALALSE